MTTICKHCRLPKEPKEFDTSRYNGFDEVREHPQLKRGSVCIECKKEQQKVYQKRRKEEKAKYNFQF